MAITEVHIHSFDVNVEAGSMNVEVYYKTGTWVGFDTDPNGWTLIGTANGVTGAGSGNPTPLNLTLNHVIPAGQTHAFYVTTDGPTMYYTNGTNVGDVYISNSHMQILEGAGKEYPFASTFTTRIWNGTIHYDGCP